MKITADTLYDLVNGDLCNESNMHFHLEREQNGMTGENRYRLYAQDVMAKNDDGKAHSFELGNIMTPRECFMTLKVLIDLYKKVKQN